MRLWPEQIKNSKDLRISGDFFLLVKSIALIVKTCCVMLVFLL
nr:MAG TPA: hypothetical protein [Caudoviricetes sp.]